MAARGRPRATALRNRGRGRKAGAGGVDFGHRLAAAAPVERLIVGKDGPVQLPQRFPGIDAELVGEQVTGMPVGGERLGLAAAAIQRQHELALQPLPQGMLPGQVLQLGGEGVVPAKRQVSIDSRLQRGEPELFQSSCLGPDERVVGQIGQDGAAPQRQRVAQRLGGLRVPARFQRGAPVREPVLEQRRVQVLTVHEQQVTVVPGH